MSAPRHVAIIMDGNGRWAESQGLERTQGHRAGADNVRQIVRSARSLGVRYLTLYAFSTANWQRPQNEVDAIFKLAVETVSDYATELKENGVRVSVAGFLEDLPVAIRKPIEWVVDYTSDNDALHLQIALSYGARRDLAHATQLIAAKVKRGELALEAIDEALLKSHLTTARFPDPDLLIRTGGETRLSDFLLYEAAYSELYFTDVLWPDFVPTLFEAAIGDFKKRERRFGQTSAQVRERL